MKRSTLGAYRLLHHVDYRHGCEQWLATRNGQPQPLYFVKLFHPRELQHDWQPTLRALEKLIASPHPNLVTYVDAGYIDGGCYVAMKHVPGQLLESLLSDTPRGKAPMDPWQACALIHGACRGLEHAYNVGQVVHRTLSPRSLMITPAGVVQVLGLDRPYHWYDDTDNPNPNIAALFPYMAPEAIMSYASTPAVEVFALGAMLYSAIVGVPPFSGATPLEVLERIVHDSPIVAPSAYTPGLPKMIDAIVTRALSHSPEARFPTPGALADALEEHVLGGSPRDALQFSLNTALTWCRDRIYDDEPNAIASLIDLRPELLEHTPLTDYVWNHAGQGTLDDLEHGIPPRWSMRGLLSHLPQTPVALRRLLRDPDQSEHTRVLAARLLGDHMQAPETIAALVDVLNGQHPWLARVATEVLASHPNAALIALCADPLRLAHCKASWSKLRLLPSHGQSEVRYCPECRAPVVHPRDVRALGQYTRKTVGPLIHPPPSLEERRMRFCWGQRLWVMEDQEVLLLGSDPYADVRHIDLEPHHVRLINTGHGTVEIELLTEDDHEDALTLTPGIEHQIDLGPLCIGTWPNEDAIRLGTQWELESSDRGRTTLLDVVPPPRHDDDIPMGTLVLDPTWESTLENDTPPVFVVSPQDPTNET